MFEIEPFKRKLGVARASGIVLCLFALGAANLTGAAQAKSDKEESKKARRRSRFLRQRPKSSRAPVWVVSCSSSGAGLDCRATQSIFHEKKTRQVLLFFTVRVPPGTKKPVMLIRVRLGVYVPAGVLIQFRQVSGAVRSASKLQPSRLLC